MARPNFLLLEPEPEQAISSRKLILETAKFNVITAYTGKECLELLDRFPGIEALIVHSQVDGMSCEELFRDSKRRNPRRTTVFLSAAHAFTCEGADHTVSSHDPEALLFLLRRLFGDPRPESSFATQ
jgi:DNA-binding response OmpR family regulator